MSPVLSHRPGRRPELLHTSRARQEHGYVLVMFALLLVPVLLMVGFAVDVGYWYNRSSDLQKAADAAALAGVVWLPDETKAEQYARAAAKRNGYEDGVNGISIDVTRIIGSSRQLKVTITDPKVSSFIYGKMTGKTISITRSSTAEYVLPVPLGSPDNKFGNDPTTSASTWPNIWGNIHGPGTDSNNGDAFAPQCKGSTNCSSVTNGTYRSTGYLYSIDVPANVSAMDVQIWDATLNKRDSENTDTGDTKYSSSGTVTTNWTFYNKDGTDLDPNDNPTAASAGICTGGGAGSWSLPEDDNDTTYTNKWVTLCKVNGTVPAGRYMLRVATSGTGAGANRYSIRVQASSTAKPRIAGYGDMSMYNNVAAGNATFYLAEVDPIHKGKTFEINMYDPGEVSKLPDGTGGDGTMQILAPNGSVVGSCDASTTSGSSPFGTDATLTPCSFTTAQGGNSKFNGSWITIDIPIPTTYSCTMGLTTTSGCWWKIKYIINGQGNDTTTWSAAIIGDPVHLINE